MIFRDVPECPYNRCVDCDERGALCAKCGWNPVVRTQRLAELMKGEDDADNTAEGNHPCLG